MGISGDLQVSPQLPSICFEPAYKDAKDTIKVFNSEYQNSARVLQYSNVSHQHKQRSLGIRIIFGLPDVNNYIETKFEERLKQRGIDIRELSSWSSIYELRQIANVVKHAEGPSSNSLRSIRPDLFSHPESAEDESLFWSASLPIYIPLAGQDLYPKSNEIEKFRKAAHAFWDELLERYFQ